MTAHIDVLFQLEKQLGIELDSLLPLAESDTLGGYHPDETQRKWGSGAVWEVEGQTLYALVRALKPQRILEIGSGTGCSTNHMAKAVQQNGSGHITTIDRANTPYVAHEFRDLIDVRNDDAINYLALQPDGSIDFLLEDADHSIQLCQAIGELAKTKLKPGGVLIAHDAAHPGVGADVKRGYDLAGLDIRVYRSDPSDCGFAVWQRPAERLAGYQGTPVREGCVQPDASPLTAIDFAVLQAQENYPPEDESAVTKYLPGVSVMVINPESKYFEQVGEVYDNYRSGLEPQAYGVRFDDGSEFWIKETDLEVAVQKTVKRTRKKASK